MSAPRAVAYTRTLAKPVEVVAGVRVTQVKIYEPVFGDLLSAPVDQKSLGESMPMWLALTDQPVEVLRELSPADAGWLVARIDLLTGPFLAAKVELALELAAEKAKTAKTDPTSSSSETPATS